MQQEKNATGKHIKGINCDVSNCIYHGLANSCHAECIAVGPSYAQSSSETVCATFKPKEDAENK